MRVVPLNRLLIQPTVQLKWLEQHQEIEFLLDETLKTRFLDVWRCFEENPSQSLVEFLALPIVEPFQIVEDDSLFALLVGADYIRQRHSSFVVKFDRPNLTWALKGAA